MAVNTILVKSYATNVYLTGRNSLTNIGATRPDYVEPVMKYCADNYWIENVDDALTNGWITAQEHADTLALKEADDPQHRPTALIAVNEVTTV